MLSFPNAKINIGLYITEKRVDGYHNLETIFFPIPLYDILEILPSNETTSLEITGLSIPGDKKNNLVLKAYYLLKEKYNLPEVKINLHKIIPMGSGLGGGSSDATHCLINLNKQFDLELTDNELIEYSLSLGSDCPFFIKNSPQYAKGRGEILKPTSIDLKGKYIVMLFSDIHISTKEAFSSINPRNTNFNLETLCNLPLEIWKNNIINDFEESAYLGYPELKQNYNTLYNLGAEFAMMSGSGSSLYGIFSELPESLNSLKNIKYKLLRIY